MGMTFPHNVQVLRIDVHANDALGRLRVNSIQSVPAGNSKNCDARGSLDLQDFTEQFGERIKLLDCG